MTGYELSRKWFDFSFENPEKIKPIHTAIYFFAIEHCNRLGWKSKFGFPSTMAMDALGIKSYNTYINALNSLVDFGFITMVEKSKNQYSSNIIALSNFNKALDKALDKALIKHGAKQHKSIDSIDKQETIEPLTNNNELGEKINFFEKELKPFFNVPESSNTFNRIYIDLVKELNGNFEKFKEQFNDYKTYIEKTDSHAYKKTIKTFLSEWDGTDWKLKLLESAPKEKENPFLKQAGQKSKMYNGKLIYYYVPDENGKLTINKLWKL